MLNLGNALWQRSSEIGPKIFKFLIFFKILKNFLNFLGHEPDVKVLLDKIAKKKADLEQAATNMSKK